MVSSLQLDKGIKLLYVASGIFDASKTATASTAAATTAAATTAEGGGEGEGLGRGTAEVLATQAQATRYVSAIETATGCRVIHKKLILEKCCPAGYAQLQVLYTCSDIELLMPRIA